MLKNDFKYFLFLLVLILASCAKRGSITGGLKEMIDGIGFNNTNFGFSDSRDGVSGYTIKQIEDVLSQTSSWNNWLTNIKNIHNNSTENNLDNLFKSYE